MKPKSVTHLTFALVFPRDPQVFPQAHRAYQDNQSVGNGEEKGD
jgi:hypothetical protein